MRESGTRGRVESWAHHRAAERGNRIWSLHGAARDLRQVDKTEEPAGTDAVSSLPNSSIKAAEAEEAIMQSDTLVLIGVALLALSFVRPLWLSWRDYRKRYQRMCERAAQYAREEPMGPEPRLPSVTGLDTGRCDQLRSYPVWLSQAHEIPHHRGVAIE